MVERVIKLAYAQTNPTFGEVESNVDDALTVIRSTDADIIVFPELFNTGYAFIDREEVKRFAEEVPHGETCRALIEESGRQKKTIVAGLAEKAGDAVYNSAVIVSKGRLVGSYRKIHLFDREKILFNRGDLMPKVYDVEGVKLGVLICFDWLFPEIWRVLALKGADIIAHPSNLVLPYYCQRAMLARSFENHIYTVTANRVGEEKRGNYHLKYIGRSQIVSPKMEVLASASDDQVECKAAQINLELARNKKLTALNDIFKDRRPKFYSALTKPFF
ncbi:MAG: nitrilase-related carbon-nitrogen hydrolase [Nitrososphaerales archaeon]